MDAQQTSEGTTINTVKSEVPQLSFEELEAVSGGDVYVEVLGHKVTTSDIADAAKWVWNVRMERMSVS